MMMIKKKPQPHPLLRTALSENVEEGKVFPVLSKTPKNILLPGRKPTAQKTKIIGKLERSESERSISVPEIPRDIVKPAKESSSFVAPSIPALPSLDFHNSSKEEILDVIQKYISSFQYNYTSTMFLKLKKSGGTTHIREIFNLITTYGLPIQCVEAVFLGSVLTAGWPGAIRIPICFKSKFQSNIYRHIVLAIQVDGKWGCLGISRRDDLMFKPFVFSSLWEVFEDFRQSYLNNYHKLLTIYCGLLMPHNFLQEQAIQWKAIKFKLTAPAETIERERLRLDTFLSQVIR
jgi:hypothetical protein